MCDNNVSVHRVCVCACVSVRDNTVCVCACACVSVRDNTVCVCACGAPRITETLFYELNK